MARYRVDPAAVAQAHQRLGPLAGRVADARNTLLTIKGLPEGGPLWAPFAGGLHAFVDAWAHSLAVDAEVLDGLAATLADAASDYGTTEVVVVPDGGAR
jgi:hypothetical protein